MSYNDTIKIKFKNIILEIFDIVSFLVFVLGIVLFVRFFVANPYTVVGASMAPTFHENDFIIVDKISNRFDMFNRGDVIVFVPNGKTTPYIKRIIGLPGEVVKIQNDSISICNSSGDSCEILVENYLSPDIKTTTRCGLTEFIIKDGYFVLGDNRGFSTDSLCCFGLGCYDGASYEVLYKDIIGKVLFRIHPDFGSDFYG